jgi:hypothetical protein
MTYCCEDVYATTVVIISQARFFPMTVDRRRLFSEQLIRRFRSTEAENDEIMSSFHFAVGLPTEKGAWSKKAFQRSFFLTLCSRSSLPSGLLSDSHLTQRRRNQKLCIRK